MRLHRMLPTHVLAFVGLVCFFVVSSAAHAAEEWKWVHEGQAKEGKITVGVRAGFSVITQQAIDNSSSGLGPGVNAMVMYGLNKWINIGAMLDWDRRSIDVKDPKSDLGTLNTVALLPVSIEFRPGRFGSIIPYMSTGIGVNINSFSEANVIKQSGTKVSTSSTFAFRLAAGMDIPITSNLAFNSEVAWRRNRGNVEVTQGGQKDDGPFDASSINLLFGVKYTFN